MNARVCLVALLLAVGACDRRVYVVGRILIPPDAATDVSAPIAPDARPVRDEPVAETDDVAVHFSCESGGACEALAATACTLPCGEGDAGVTVCNCVEGHWTDCTAGPNRCGSEEACAPPRDCRPAPRPCQYCDVTRGTSIRCECAGATPTWACRPAGQSCD